jgi:hypothetical protein
MERLGIYFTYNRLFARETMRKQGMHFGLDDDAPATPEAGETPAAATARTREDA